MFTLIPNRHRRTLVRSPIHTISPEEKISSGDIVSGKMRHRKSIPETSVSPTSIMVDRGGFTLMELLVVVAIMSVMAIAVVPRISNALSGGRGNLNILTSLIVRTYDNAFLRGEECYLAIHCEAPPMKSPDQDVLARENGVSVLAYGKDGTLADSKSHMLKSVTFPGSFRINEVILSTGQIIQSGTVLIPFNPEGYSDDAIVHVTAGDERFSVIIYKLRKEPRVVPEHVSFDDVRSGNVL